MSIEAKSAAVIAAGSGTATVLSAIGEVTLQILGVPLPVVLACGTGAWIARSYAPASSLLAALPGTAGWTIAGCVLAPLAAALARRYLGLELPTNALAGIGLIVSLVLPMVLPILKEEGPRRLRAWIKGASK